MIAMKDVCIFSDYRIVFHGHLSQASWCSTPCAGTYSHPVFNYTRYMSALKRFQIIMGTLSSFMANA